MMIIWVAILLGMISAERSGANTIEVKDLTGRQISLAAIPSRVVCLAPGTLRLIVYLQAQGHIVGIEDIETRFPTSRPYWIACSELGALPSIGPGGVHAINQEPALEKLLSVGPDLIFISYMARDKADDLQHKLGIPVVVLSYGPFGSFDETLYDSLRIAGKILGKDDRAEAVITFIENEKKALSARVKDVSEKEKPTAYIGGIGFKGTQGLGSTETSYMPLNWIEAKNAAANRGKTGHLFLDKETILTINPEVIFVDGGGIEWIRQDFAQKKTFYLGLKAFQQKKVYTLHAHNWYITNIGTVIANAYTAGKILYPEQFSDIVPEVKADEIYTYLVGKPVYRKLARNQGTLGRIPAWLK